MCEKKTPIKCEKNYFILSKYFITIPQKPSKIRIIIVSKLINNYLVCVCFEVANSTFHQATARTKLASMTATARPEFSSARAP